MNKKFSTLVASLLLVAGSAAYTPAFGQIGVSAPILKTEHLLRTGVSPWSATNPAGGYQVGQSYFLGRTTGYLTVTDDGYLVWTSAEGSKVADIENSLWTLTSLNTSAGANAPQYSFVNKKTGYVLAFDPSQAVSLDNIASGSNKLGGSQVEWLSAPSYRDPWSNDGAKMYASIGDDQIIALAKATGSEKVVLVKTTKDKLTNNQIVVVNPFVLQSGNSMITMSPNQLNTMLGLTGSSADKDSYFTLDFNPEATTNGEKNIWSEELQAVAVDQFELVWGGDPADKDDVVKNADYASLYPRTDKDIYDNSYNTLKGAAVSGFKSQEPEWVAVRNRDGKYLVVDTAYVKGTGQTATPRLTFAWDDLYNAKDVTRFRNPESYLFRFDYNPINGKIEITSRGYIIKREAIGEPDIFDEAAFYTAYSEQAIKQGQKWTGATSGNVKSYTSESNDNKIIRATLATINEVTVGEKAPGDATKDSNLFTITFGGAAKYIPTIMPNGAYLIKVVSSNTPSRVGKYLVNNLKGGYECMEEAVRQNFQHMPAAQWILTSPTQTAGAPVRTANREFGGGSDVYGVLYAVEGHADQAYIPNDYKETYQFIKVAEPSDKYQGYLYVADDTIKERVFNFNYLHELAMDKSINTLSDKDSVVWVDANGGAIDFELVKAYDDEYGETTTGVTRLTRRAYKIKVKDASKLESDGRYLAYNPALKKYVISAKNAGEFFLKENNEVEGGNCYYTLITPNRSHVVSIKDGAFIYFNAVNGYFDITGASVTSMGDQVIDNDVMGMFLRDETTVKDPETGLDKKVSVIKTYAPDEAPDFAGANVVTVKVGDDLKKAILFGGRISQDPDGNYHYNTYLPSPAYADSKVSVDNNTLNLTNGVIYDYAYDEVANSAFAVVPGNNPKYRNLELEKPANMAIYRVKSTEKAYLYEDATSIYSKDKDFNFLGVEDKGVEGKNPTLFVDTAYVEREGNTQYRYLLGLRETVTDGVADICPICGKEDCEHSKVTRTHTDAWYLVNLSDSVALNNGAAKAKYQWNREYTRLGFVEACHRGDSLIIKNSVWTGDTRRIDPYSKTDFRTYASKDTIKLDKNDNNVTFSLRLIDDSDNFLLQSRSNAWVKIQNGVPVLATGTYNEVAKDAEIFNIEASW